MQLIAPRLYSLMMWSSILVTISPCCSTSIARSINIEWISVIPSSSFLISLCLKANGLARSSKEEEGGHRFSVSTSILVYLLFYVILGIIAIVVVLILLLGNFTCLSFDDA